MVKAQRHEALQQYLVLASGLVEQRPHALVDGAAVAESASARPRSA